MLHLGGKKMGRVELFGFVHPSSNEMAVVRLAFFPLSPISTNQWSMKQSTYHAKNRNYILIIWFKQTESANTCRISFSWSLGLWHVTFNRAVICLSFNLLVYRCPSTILQAWQTTSMLNSRWELRREPVTKSINKKRKIISKHSVPPKVNS